MEPLKLETTQQYPFMKTRRALAFEPTDNGIVVTVTSSYTEATEITYREAKRFCKVLTKHKLLGTPLDNRIPINYNLILCKSLGLTFFIIGDVTRYYFEEGELNQIHEWLLKLDN